MNAPTPPARDPWLLPLALTAVIARIVDGLGSELINADGYFYAEAAAKFAAGDWGEALRSGLHPLYPLLLAGPAALLGSAWLAGAAISTVAAGASVVPLYRLAREGWGERPARAAALLFALHPVLADWDAKVLTDAVYRLCALWALWWGWSAFRDGSVRRGLAAGAALAGAYYARSEGVLLALLFFGAAVLLVLVRFRTARAAAALGAAAAVLLLLAAPYVLWIRAERGVWRPSPRGSVERAVQAGAMKTYDDSGREARRREKYGLGPAAVMNVAIAVWRTWYVPPVLLAAAGLLAFRRGAGGGPTGAFLGLLVAGNLAAVGLLYYLSVTHISFRYVALPCLLLLPWSGWGLARLLERLDALGRGPLPGRVALGVVAIAMAARIVHHPADPEDRALREAAAWLAAHAPPRHRLAASSDAIAYHAGARYVYVLRPADVRARLDEGAIDFLAYTEADLREEELRAVLDRPGVREAGRFGPEGKGVRVYEVARPRGAGTGGSPADGR